MEGSVRHKETISAQVWVATLPILILIAVVIKPSPYRKLFFIPIFCIAHHVVFTADASDLMAAQTLGNTAFCYLFTASDFILLTDVQNELRQVGQEKPAWTFPLARRFQWAFNLFISPQGGGWTHGDPKLYMNRAAPPNTATTRRRFLTRRVLRMLVNIALFDVTSVIMLWLSSNFPLLNAPETISWTKWFQIRLAYFAFPLWVCTRLNVGFCLLSSVTVALGIYKPEDWPKLFGSVWDAYTVRNVWSKTWHQGFRRVVSAHGKFVAHKVLHLQPGPAASFVHILVAFLVSGIIHAAGDYTALKRWGGGCFMFFPLQGLVIILEYLVISFATRRGFKANAWWRVVGYVWVACWFLHTMPYFADPLLRTGGFARLMDSTLVLRHLL